MRDVTERDLRAREFADGEPSDYEFRPDGRIVRKDRWERAIHSIRCALGDRRREFEVPEIVNAVRALVNSIETPEPPADDEEEDLDA